MRGTGTLMAQRGRRPRARATNASDKVASPVAPNASVLGRGVAGQKAVEAEQGIAHGPGLPAGSSGLTEPSG